MEDRIVPRLEIRSKKYHAPQPVERSDSSDNSLDTPPIFSGTCVVWMEDSREGLLGSEMMGQG
jgi:hypothetical protein